MAHHAYYAIGEEGLTDTLSYIDASLGLPISRNPDVLVLRYDLFSVDDVRVVQDAVHRKALTDNGRAIVIHAKRLFHEAQNALLKTVEEPPPQTYLFLIVSSPGVLLDTLRSRLQALPGGKTQDSSETVITEKSVGAILTRAKSDKQEEKQAARIEALTLAQQLLRRAYALKGIEQDPELLALVSDLNRLIPILHERSAPLKPILEHVLICTPKRLLY